MSQESFRELNVVAVLFVCLGNICRSPTAEGVFRHTADADGLGDQVTADSAGTGAYHIGDPPDNRAQGAARKRGIDLSGQRARQVNTRDFERFDYVIAMDQRNLMDLQSMCPKDAKADVRLFLDFAPGAGAREVPDPYYGAGDGFEVVLDLVEAASKGLLADIRQKHLNG